MKPTIKQVQAAVSTRFDCSVDQLLSKDRARRYARPRQIAMKLSYELTGRSLMQIGRNFGRDHTTVLHARRKIAALEQSSKKLAAAINDCRGLILLLAEMRNEAWAAGVAALRAEIAPVVPNHEQASEALRLMAAE
jgi:hypothetical protein